jgi:tetratricopeptide (TPR) repeat protein
MPIPLHAKRLHNRPWLGDMPVMRLLPVALFVATTAVFPVSASAAEWNAASSNDTVPAANSDLAKLVAAIPQSRIDSEPKAKALQALNLIGKNQLKEGSVMLNTALQLDPSNSYLQFFNAYTYHLMAQAGDTEKFSLAEQGYALAIKFDRSNWIAHYYLGMLHFEQRNFRAAQSELAEVMLFHEDDQDVLFRMVAASYYAGDPVTAAACLDRLRVLDPHDVQVLRLSALISAAIGRQEEAQRWLAQYRATKPNAIELARTQERIKHWSVVRRDAPIKPASTVGEDGMPIKGVSLARLRNPGFMRTEDDSDNATDDEKPNAASPNASQSSSQSAADNTADAQMSSQNGSPAVAKSNRMVLVDVVIMRTEDSLSTTKGVNLLNALTLQFGGKDSAAAFSKSYSSTDTAGSVTASTTLTRAISIPALTYSLNIANSNANLNEVLARPTLAALDGLKSDFFSGTTLNAAVVATGANSGGAVQIEKEIGVKLSIVPTFMPDGKIRLTVDAQRTFLKPPSQDVSFTYKVEVSKIMVNANVVMDFGETLVLGGLSEKETTRVRDGVPLLQDIPGVQYLFSRKDTNDFQRSVLMLITPRKPQYTFRSDAALRNETGDNADAESMKELRARYGDWFKPYPNMASVFNHLNSSSIYREFRTGDVTLEKWDRQVTTQERLKQALEFLFY